MNTLRRSAFTLVEVLIVIAVVGVLSGIVVTAVNPQRQYTVANDSKRAAAQREIQNAVQQYILDHGADQLEIIEITRLLTPGQAGKVPICKDGVTYNASCINLDVFVEENYLQALPVDVNEPETSDVTGFTVQILPDGQIAVDNEHLQQGVASDSFTNPAAWTSFTPSNNGVGSDPRGYQGSAFDGRYVYFAPYAKSNPFTTAHGEILRYDTTGSFTNDTSWQSMDLNGTALGFGHSGYSDAVYDGRYVYFIPIAEVFYPVSSARPNNKLLRYDTSGEFTNASAWEYKDLRQITTSSRGYDGQIFDGQHLYLLPAMYDNGTTGPLIRYNVAADFSANGSYELVDLRALLGSNAKGFSSGTYDGRYVYFAPNWTITGTAGTALKYDTQEDLGLVSSWEIINLPSLLGAGHYGYTNAFFDGKYVYLTPFGTSSTDYHGRMVRYDITQPFSQSSSWESFAISTLNPQAVGYYMSGADDRYLYFSPYRFELTLNGYHGKFARYDRTKPFSDPAAWRIFDAPGQGIGIDPEGFRGVEYDGRYIYFTPLKNGPDFSGEFIRYDTKLPIE